MSRTYETLVAGIIELDPSIEVDPFITAASALVDQIEEEDELDDDRLELIETWLAAHFYCMRDPRSVSERAGPVSASYETKIGFNLQLSKYGQMAMVLDTTGTLASLNNTKPRRTASVTWLGTEAE